MNLIHVPSLEHIALAKIVTTLWDHRSIKNSIEAISFEQDHEKVRKEIEEKVLENASLLLPSGMLTEKIRGVVKPIGRQIWRWIKEKATKFDFPFNERYELFWTPEGTLDKKKMAKALVDDETRDIRKRFEIACFYCLESDIQTIWNNMPECHREYFFEYLKDFDLHEYIEDFYSEDFDNCPLIDFWIHEINNKEDEMENLTEFQKSSRLCHKAMECAVAGNRLATEYFFNKLDPLDRGSAMRYALEYSNLDWDILHFFLSQANEDQREHMFKTFLYSILEGFLKWPNQVYLMEMTNHVSSFLNTKDCFWMLHKIVNKVKKGYKDYDYQTLFAEFWQKMPTSCKEPESIVKCFGRDIRKRLCEDLFDLKDVKNSLLILKEISAEDRERMFDPDVFIHFSQYLAEFQEWNRLEFFLGELISSPEEMVRFKGRCEEIIVRRSNRRSAGDIQKFFKLLDDLVQTRFEKRSAEVEDSCSQSTKRLRSCSTES